MRLPGRNARVARELDEEGERLRAEADECAAMGQWDAVSRRNADAAVVFADAAVLHARATGHAVAVAGVGVGLTVIGWIGGHL
jgi:hypothetical protein